ncbi:hypothetical protein HCBG_08659 [Histoplasma capsulatum G186AR]|uniref:Secreted protein n=1 Tax=Ajellomyces capsulatus (strain G186AR / H82 / ATCC MYA-2454 / RMSCC 2432) TaxID=447093 RepID=C0NZS9_AJECG|nr:uncharacterized protein HCBG_08659 [Histoplasma capsulatum G186AR]EEH03018.1 hypothetical protein HCBG_08659 [Histoplasma capsulatum G186AR]
MEWWAPGDHSLAFWAFLVLQPLPIALPAAAGGQPNNRESVTDYLPTTQNCGLELRRPPPSPYRPTAENPIKSETKPCCGCLWWFLWVPVLVDPSPSPSP